MKSLEEKQIEEFVKMSSYVEIQIGPFWEEWFDRYQKKIISFIQKCQREIRKKERDKMIEYLSHDMEWDSEGQRKYAVKMYKKHYDEEDKSINSK